MDKTLKKSIFFIILGFVSIFFLFIGLMDIIKPSNIYEVKIDSAYPVLTVEHVTNFIFPTGTDYYYLGVNEENRSVYLIKANKNWLNKNFTSDNTPLNGTVFEIKGMRKSFDDFKVKKKIEEKMSDINDYDFPLQKDYLSMNYYGSAIMKLTCAGFLILSIIFWIIYNCVSENSKAKTVSLLSTALCIIVGLVLVIIILK